MIDTAYILVFLAVLVIAVFLVFYFLRILKNLFILAVITFLIVYFAVKLGFLPRFDLLFSLVVFLAVALIYLVAEFLQIFSHVFEVIKEMILILLSPLRIIWNALKSLFSKDDPKKREENESS